MAEKQGNRVAPLLAIAAVGVAGCVQTEVHPPVHPPKAEGASVTSKALEAHFRHLPRAMAEIKGVLQEFNPATIAQMTSALNLYEADGNEKINKWGKEVDGKEKTEEKANFDRLVALIGSERAALAYIASVTSIR